METLNEWIIKAHIAPFWDNFNYELLKKIKEVKNGKLQ
jgi:hypothetical protein